MHIYAIGEQEIWLLYFCNPYYFRTSVKTTFKGKKFNKAAIKCNLLTGFLTTYLKISAKLVLFLFKTPNFKPVYLRSALSDCDAVYFIWKYFSSPTFKFEIWSTKNSA